MKVYQSNLSLPGCEGASNTYVSGRCENGTWLPVGTHPWPFIRVFSWAPSRIQACVADLWDSDPLRRVRQPWPKSMRIWWWRSGCMSVCPSALRKAGYRWYYMYLCGESGGDVMPIGIPAYVVWKMIFPKFQGDWYFWWSLLLRLTWLDMRKWVGVEEEISMCCWDLLGISWRAISCNCSIRRDLVVGSMEYFHFWWNGVDYYSLGPTVVSIDLTKKRHRI